jgi:hypothetical protein
VNGSFRACAMVAALASGVGAAVCDGGSGDIENACDLLTTNEVTAFMGTPMVRGLGDGAYFYIKDTAEVPFLELRVGTAS